MDIVSVMLSISRTIAIIAILLYIAMFFVIYKLIVKKNKTIRENIDLAILVIYVSVFTYILYVVFTLPD